MHRSRWLVSATAAAVGLGAAACGGGTTPTVAHLGSTTTTAAAVSSGTGDRPTLAQATRYSQCMRSHGVPGFPDPTPGPNGGFGFQVQGKVGAGGNDTEMQSAQNACKSLLPNHGVGKPLTAAQQQAFLHWAACIRAHGLPNFPDPDFTGGGVRISISAGDVGGPAGSASGPPPQLQAAQKACQSKLPSGFAKLGG